MTNANLGNPNWKKGLSGNPNGRPAGSKSFIDRARYLMEEYSIEQIREFISDEKKFAKLPVYDAMVMRRIAEAVSDNGNQSMNSLLDRVLGKAPQYVEQYIEQNMAISYEERRREAQIEADDMLNHLGNRNKESEIGS